MTNDDDPTQPTSKTRNTDAELQLTAIYITLATTAMNWMTAQAAHAPDAERRSFSQMQDLAKQIIELRRRYPTENMNLVQGAYQEWNR